MLSASWCIRGILFSLEIESLMMKLDENDHLTYQLFAASGKSSVKKTRLRGWAITTGTFLVLGLLFLQQKNELLAKYFMVLSALSLILYPVYSRWRYKRHYRKHVRDTFENASDENSTIHIGEDTIITKDDHGTKVQHGSDPNYQRDPRLLLYQNKIRNVVDPC